MAVVHKRVIIAGVAALPLERDGIAVAGVAIAHGIVRIELRLVGDAHRAVGVAGIDHIHAGVDRIAAVDVRKAGCRHGDRHHVLPVGPGIICDRELSAVFVPGADMVGAIGVLEELDQDIVLLIADALGQGIHKGVLTQVACLRGDAGEGGDDLVVDQVAAGSGRGMGVAVGNIRGAAVVLSGVDSGFTQGFLQTGNAGQVFGIQRHIVQPGIAAVFGVRAVDGRHGQRDQEGIGRVDHRFGNAGLNKQVQAEGQIICGGMAVSIGFRQGSAAAGVDILFKRVLDSGGIVRESSLKTGDQLVRLIVIHRLAAGSLIRRLIPIFGRQTENGEEDVAFLRGFDPIE